MSERAALLTVYVVEDLALLASDFPPKRSRPPLVVALTSLHQARTGQTQTRLRQTNVHRHLRATFPPNANIAM